MKKNKVIILVDTMGFGGSERTAQILLNNQNGIDSTLQVVSLANVWKYPINDDVKRFTIFNKNYITWNIACKNGLLNWNKTEFKYNFKKHSKI